VDQPQAISPLAWGCPGSRGGSASPGRAPRSRFGACGAATRLIESHALRRGCRHPGDRPERRRLESKVPSLRSRMRMVVAAALAPRPVTTLAGPARRRTPTLTLLIAVRDRSAERPKGGPNGSVEEVDGTFLCRRAIASAVAPRCVAAPQAWASLARGRQKVRVGQPTAVLSGPFSADQPGSARVTATASPSTACVPKRAFAVPCSRLPDIAAEVAAA
jgi:hypothetical protein